MRKLTQAQVLTLVEASQDVIAKAVVRLRPLFSPVITEAWLNYAVKEGFIYCNQINLDDQMIGVIWYHPSSNGELVVNACASFTGENKFAAFVAAAKLIAEDIGCKFVRFETMRPGLVAKATTMGFEISGVSLSIKL